MKDDANPTAWQLAGLALALGIVVTGVALADEPRLEVGGEPGGVVQTVDESPERQRELVRLLDEAEDADDHDGPDEAVEPADDDGEDAVADVEGGEGD